jgi:hypothetical protein
VTYWRTAAWRALYAILVPVTSNSWLPNAVQVCLGFDSLLPSVPTLSKRTPESRAVTSSAGRSIRLDAQLVIDCVNDSLPGTNRAAKHCLFEAACKRYSGKTVVNAEARGKRQGETTVNKHSLALSLFLLLGSTVSAQTTNNKPAAPDETDCANLAGASNPLWSIKSAEFVQPPLSIAARRGTQGKISVETPFCRVTGRVTLNARSEIDFELWLPRRHDWNGKFAGVGSGASRGTIEYQALMRALRGRSYRQWPSKHTRV